MTRDEQMWEAVAQEHGDLTMRDALTTLTALEYADKTMIEKACQWMKEQVYQEYGGGPLERLIPDTRIEEFRKAMEE